MMTEAQILALEAGLLVNALLTLHLGAKAEYVVEKMSTLLVNVKNVAGDEHFHKFFFAQLAYVLKKNELSPEKVHNIIYNFNNTVKMNAYDALMKTLEEKGMEKGILEGASLQSQQVVRNILAEFSTWENEKIANLANTTVEVVVTIRAEVKIKK